MHFDEELIEQTIELASSWQTYANRLHHEFDKEFYSIMNSIQMYPQDKILLIELLETMFVCTNNKRMAHLVDYLLEKYGIAEFFTKTQKALLWFFKHSTKNIPDVSIPFFKDYLKAETQKLLVCEDNLDEFLQRKDYQEVKTTINLLGGITLNEFEAQRAIENYIRELGNPYIKKLSIKISSIDSMLDLTDFDNSVNRLVNKLSLIFRQAQKYPYKGKGKIVFLEMEEFTTLPIIIESFKQVLQKEEFKSVKAGITLQAYLKKSLEIVDDILHWAKKRTNQGGEKIIIRLVKGKCLKKEYVTSVLKPLSLPTFTQKVHTDAMFKTVASILLKPENEKLCEVFVATHNIFDLAYTYTVAQHLKQQHRLTFEMFEGINESLKIAIKEQNKEVTTYSSVLLKNDFSHGIDFLIKRINDLTSKCSFLSHTYKLQIGSKNWKEYQDTFMDSLKQMKNNQQFEKEFLNHNEALTDFREHANRVWLQQMLEEYGNQTLKFEEPSKAHFDSFLEHEATFMPCFDAQKKSLWLNELMELIRKQRHLFLFTLKKDVTTNDKEISLAIDMLNLFKKHLLVLNNTFDEKSASKSLYVLHIDETFAFNDMIALICGALLFDNKVIVKSNKHLNTLLFALKALFEQSQMDEQQLLFVACEHNVKKLENAHHIEKNRSAKKAFYISGVSNKEFVLRTIFNSSLKHCVDYWSSITLILQEDVYTDEKFLQRLTNSKNIKDRHIIYNNKKIQTHCVKNVQEATAFINEKHEYMSASIESLDEEELEYFIKKCTAEHLYINKSVECESQYLLTTAQEKKSFYLPKRTEELLYYFNHFVNIQCSKIEPIQQKKSLNAAFVQQLAKIDSFEKNEIEAFASIYENFSEAFNKQFHGEDEYKYTEVQKSVIRYKPCDKVLIYMDEQESLNDLLCRIMACKIANISFYLWCKGNKTLEDFCFQHKKILFTPKKSFIIKQEKELHSMLLECDRIVAYKNQDWFKEVEKSKLFLNEACAQGYMELRNYFYEQRLYRMIHRYGIKIDKNKAYYC